MRACAASDTPLRPIDTETLNVQAIWRQPTEPLSAAVGMHRIALGESIGRGFGFPGRASASAPVKDACAATPVEASPAGGGGRSSAGLRPGPYTVRLTVDGETYTQPVTVKPDPRGVPEER